MKPAQFYTDLLAQNGFGNEYYSTSPQHERDADRRDREEHVGRWLRSLDFEAQGDVAYHLV